MGFSISLETGHFSEGYLKKLCLLQMKNPRLLKSPLKRTEVKYDGWLMTQQVNAEAIGKLYSAF